MQKACNKKTEQELKEVARTRERPGIGEMGDGGPCACPCPTCGVKMRSLQLLEPRDSEGTTETGDGDAEGFGGECSELRALALQGAPIDVANSGGNTPVRIASGAGHLDVERWLRAQIGREKSGKRLVPA